MRWLRYTVLILLISVAQASIVEELAITDHNIRPDFMLILLVFFAIYSNTTDAVITSFTIGFAADLVGSAMGTHMLSFGVTGAVIAWLHRYLAIRKMTYQAAAVFVVAIVTELIVRLLIVIKGQNVPADIYPSLLGSALYSALIGPFLFLPFAWWMRIKPHNFGHR